MKFFERLMGRASDDNPQFGIEVPLEIVEGDRLAGLASGRVSRTRALSVPAVLRARNMIAGTLGGLPVHVRDRNKQIVQPAALFDQIDPDVPNVVTLALTYEDLLFEGISWWRVLALDSRGFPSKAEHIRNERVHVSSTPGIQQLVGNPAYPVGGRVHIDGIPIPDDQIIRFDSPNPALLVHAARAIHTAIMLEETAAMYSKSPVPLGYFAPKAGGVDMEKADIQALLDEWERARRTRAWGYVGAAWDVNVLQMNPEQIQLDQQRQHAVLEIARAAGVSPEDLGVSTTSRTYANREQERQDMLDFTLQAYVRTLEERLSMRDVLPRGQSAKVNLDAFLRSDTKTRLQTYAIGIPHGIYTPDEARELEDRPPLTRAQRSQLPTQQPTQEPPTEEDS